MLIEEVIISGVRLENQLLIILNKKLLTLYQRIIKILKGFMNNKVKETFMTEDKNAFKS